MRISDYTRNRLQVLKAIRTHGPIARSELAPLTGLSGGTITQVTADLMKRGTVHELSRRDRGQSGRPRIYLAINASSAVVIGASMAGSGVLTTSFVDLAGTQLHFADVCLRERGTLELLAESLADGLERATAGSPFELSEIDRIGLAVPGLVDSRRGVVHHMSTFPVQPFALAERLTKRLGVPVTVENGMLCAARAQHWFGLAREIDTFTLIDVSFAVGSADYRYGLPQVGANGFSRDLGHVKVASGPHALPCYCGAQGCLSAYASVYGILQRAGMLKGEQFPPLGILKPGFSSLLDRADAGEVEALTLVKEAGRYLGVAASNYVNSTDPGTILVQFSEARYRRLAVPAMMSTVREQTLPGIMAQTDFVFDETDGSWRRTGTAALALEMTYLQEHLRASASSRTHLLELGQEAE